MGPLEYGIEGEKVIYSESFLGLFGLPTSHSTTIGYSSRMQGLLIVSLQGWNNIQPFVLRTHKMI